MGVFGRTAYAPGGGRLSVIRPAPGSSPVCGPHGGRPHRTGSAAALPENLDDLDDPTVLAATGAGETGGGGSGSAQVRTVTVFTLAVTVNHGMRLS
jgi:hypothetical protein